MKTFLTTRLYLVIFMLWGFQGVAAEPAYLLEVKKDTPLLSQPSAQSEKLAVAEEGTMLLYLGKSRTGSWLKLRDSDGLVGWMPANRTDYADVSAAKQEIDKIQEIGDTPAAPPPSKEEMMEDIMKQKEQQRETFHPKLRIAPLMRWISDSEPASTRIGLRAEYNLASLAMEGGERFGQAWGVLEATFPAPQVAHSGSDFSAAARYALRAPIWGPTYYGTDFGYSVDKVRSEYRHHLSVGLAAGVAVGPADFAVRGGYDLFAHSRYYAEIQLGVSF